MTQTEGYIFLTYQFKMGTLPDIAPAWTVSRQVVPPVTSFTTETGTRD